jgi:hypothetical protein
MNISLSRFLIIIGVVVMALAACQPLSKIPARGPQAASQQPELDLTLVHSNDTWGYTDPCG